MYIYLFWFKPLFKEDCLFACPETCSNINWTRKFLTRQQFILATGVKRLKSWVWEIICPQSVRIKASKAGYSTAAVQQCPVNEHFTTALALMIFFLICRIRRGVWSIRIVIKKRLNFFGCCGNLCYHSPILGMHSLTKNLHDLQKRVFGDNTDVQTDTQTDKWTLQLYDWIGPVNWFSQNNCQGWFCKKKVSE